MFQFQNVWLPDGEKHFPSWMEKNGEIVDGRGTYQIVKFREAMRYVRRHRVAVDVGAHVGLWAMQLTKQFATVHAFEPMEQFRECWKRNVNGGRAMMHPYALGASGGFVRMSYDPADSGGTHVERGAAAIDEDPAVVPMMTLDELALDDVDFLKVDCEGAELAVLQGAHETLQKWRPCVIVEQKAHKLAANYGVKGAPAVDYLVKMGALIRAVLSGDYVLSW